MWVEMKESNGTAHEPAVKAEMDALSSPSPDSAANINIWPYIPQAQQQRSGLLIDFLLLHGQEASETYLDLLILGERKYGVLLAKLPQEFRHSIHDLAALKRSIRAQNGGLSPSGTLRALENLLGEKVGSRNFQAAYAVFNQQTQTLVFAATRNIPIFLYRPTRKQLYRLISDNMAPAGTTLDDGSEGNLLRKTLATIKSEKVRLHQHDLVLFLSEGFLQIHNAWGDVYGLQRFKDFIKQHGNMQPTPLLNQFQTAIEEFMMGELLPREYTVVAVKNMQAEGHATLEENAAEIEDRFLTVDEEEELWRTTDEYPELRLRELVNILGRRFVRLGPERIRFYLRNDFRIPSGKEDKEAAPRRSFQNLEKHFHQELLEEFPIRQLLYRKYEFRGNTDTISKALELYQNGHFQESLIEFMKVRKAIANSESVYCFFGNLYLLLNMSIKARQEYIKALRLNPRSVPAHLGLAYISLLHKDYEGTINYLSTAIRLDNRLQLYERFLHRLIGELEKQNGHQEWLA